MPSASCRTCLDTDFYKLTMMQAVLHNYPNAEVEWEFRCRNAEDLRPYLAEIRYQIERLAEVEVTADQLAFLERIPFMKPDFIRFLSLFRFNLRLRAHRHRGWPTWHRLRGPWLHVILFDVPLLAIVSEVRNRCRYREVVLEQVGEQLYRKLDWLSAQASSEELAESRSPTSAPAGELLPHPGGSGAYPQARLPGRFVGTSNVHLAREYDLKPIGTMASRMADGPSATRPRGWSTASKRRWTRLGPRVPRTARQQP
ncbi:hypothetical protein ACPA9J_04930 [Pseudomonas aeruginosa]